MKRVIILFHFLFLLCCLPHTATAKVLEVGSHFNYSTIRDALYRARPHDTILVYTGIYHEKNLVIDKPVILRGVERPILDGDGKYEILSVKADSVVIDGFLLRNTGASSIVDYAAIKVYESKGVTISHNIILNSFFGIYLQYASHCVINSNELRSAASEEINSGNGIHCWNSNHLLIEGNRITGHRDGIYFEFVKNSLIRKNSSFSNLRYGLHFMFSNDDSYEGNVFKGNGAGVAVMFSRQVNMTGNVFEENWGDASYGILLKEISGGRVERNIFKKNTCGIYLEGVSRISFQYNRFHTNGFALKIQASCMDNIISRNNFTDNSFDISTNGTLVLNTFDYNYWDKYEGYDMNRDKVGDIPYRPVSLFSVIMEKNPTTFMMFRSFISLLMDKTEKLIPSLTPEGLLDNHPLINPVVI